MRVGTFPWYVRFGYYISVRRIVPGIPDVFASPSFGRRLTAEVAMNRMSEGNTFYGRKAEITSTVDTA